MQRDFRVQCKVSGASVLSRVRMLSPKCLQIETSADDAVEYKVNGGINIFGNTLEFYMMEWQFAPAQTVYLRFFLDVPNNATVTGARLHLRSASESCQKSSELHIEVEDSDHAGPIQAWKSGSLGSRPIASGQSEA